MWSMENTDTSCSAEHGPDGVDLTLIRWMLEMTPAERLQTLQAFVDAVWRVRGDDGEA